MKVTFTKTTRHTYDMTRDALVKMVNGDHEKNVDIRVEEIDGRDMRHIECGQCGIPISYGMQFHCVPFRWNREDRSDSEDCEKTLCDECYKKAQSGEIQLQGD